VYASRCEKWCTANAHLDIKKKSRKSTDTSGTTPSFLGNCTIEMDDAKKLELINGLNYKHGVNLHDKQADGSVLVLTGAAMTTNTVQFSSKIKISCSPAGTRTGAEHRALWWMQ
jgi:hypothetical protein